MERRERFLPLLGLCLRGGRLAVGEEAVEAACQRMDARLILLASDAAERTERQAQRLAEQGRCLWARLPASREELGRALGRSGASVAAVTDTGLACAVSRRLAELDGERYGALADRLELKLRRAAQRQAEAKARGGAPHRRPRREVEKPPEKPRASIGTRTGPGARARKRSPQGRPASGERSSPRRGAGPFAHSRPVKKGKGSFRKKES